MVVGEQKPALETQWHANNDICYIINALQTVTMPLLVYSASGGYYCQKFDLGLKGHKGQERSGVFAQNNTPTIENTHLTHTCCTSENSYLPQTSINVQLPLSERRTHILHQNISNDIFGVWKRISIRQILQRLKLQRRLFDIWSPSLA